MNPNQTTERKISYKTTQILINTSNYVSGNTYRYTFPTPIDFSTNKCKVGLSQYSMYNSTYNISSALGNNTYTIKWIDGTVQTFIIPDGYYSFDDINQNINYNCTINGWYLQNNTNSAENMYFITVSANSIQYKSQINIYYVPSTLPSGYSNAGKWSLPSSNTYPQLILCTGLLSLFGFQSQTNFPAPSVSLSNATQNLIYLSDNYPVLSPVFCYVLGCNLINNSFVPVPFVFYQIPLTVSFGSILQDSPSNFHLIDVESGKYRYIEIYIYDQNLNPVTLVDPEISLNLILQFEIEIVG